MNVGIVLAAGKGKRFGSSGFNKNSVKFLGKPLVKYGTDLLGEICDKLIVVVGVYPEGVIESVGRDPKVSFVVQKRRLGTGHAVKVAVSQIAKNAWTPDKVWIGYGDHMMFYTPEIVLGLSQKLNEEDGVLSMITCDHDKPDLLAWGRIIRNKKGDVVAIVEQKDASPKERKVNELNAGMYCLRFDFLKDALSGIKKSPVSGEYYLTDLIKIAVAEGKKVIGVNVPFRFVGIGINTKEELVESQKLYQKMKSGRG